MTDRTTFDTLINENSEDSFKQRLVPSYVEENFGIDGRGGEQHISAKEFDVPPDEMRRKLNLLVLNHFINEGHVNAAHNFAKELGISYVVKQIEEEDKEEGSISDELDNGESVDNSSLENFQVSSYFEPDSIQKDIDQGYKDVYWEDNQNVYKMNLDQIGRLTEGLSTIKVRNNIKRRIIEGRINEAINIINEKFPLLLENNQYICFKLLHLELIEKIRTQFASIQSGDEESDKRFLEEVLNFISSNLSSPNILQNNRMLKELELTMALLCFRDQFKEDAEADKTHKKGVKKVPAKLRRLMDIRLRFDVASMVSRTIITEESSIDMSGKSEENSCEPYKMKVSDLSKKRDSRMNSTGDSMRDSMRGTMTDPESNSRLGLDRGSMQQGLNAQGSPADVQNEKLDSSKKLQQELKSMEKILEKPGYTRLTRLIKLAIWSYQNGEPGRSEELERIWEDNQ
ncbi:hypothetical protein FOA43_004151 [Brettanomyces nanus]|uniref:CTLH domain-containing protein n=1 Tax=Eeniella nana TaxID=13502 RepID=A0A875RX92_EENNA|nr:uncharacterized protein FOA43_004151 [Brettanomyces nanus]QPG76757.1 hypothetical protein FOA43_004151 [Brettanomyces nanus]